jgi:aminotransferase
VAICAPTVSQYAALAALEGPQYCVGEIRETLARRRDLTCSRLDRMRSHFSYVKPHGAYYLMARSLRTDVDSMTLALQVLNEARVITIPGGAFGPHGENHLRLSFGGREDEIETALDRLESWMDHRFHQ